MVGGAGGVALGAVGGTTIGVALGALVTALTGGLGAPLGIALATAGAAGGGLLGMGSLMTGGAVLGAKIGAGGGALLGLVNSGDAVEKKKQDLMDSYERNEARLERREAMDMRREMSRMNLARQAQGMGVSPDSLPRGMSGQGRQMA